VDALGPQDAVLQLLDHVLLIAPVVGAGHDLGRGEVGAGGDVEEVADLIEQGVLAAGLGEVLAQRDHPVAAGAFAGLVVELGDVLAGEADGEVAAFGDDALLVVPLTLPGLPGRRRPERAWSGARLTDICRSFGLSKIN
jgi:hypothetical protein